MQCRHSVGKWKKNVTKAEVSFLTTIGPDPLTSEARSQFRRLERSSRASPRCRDSLFFD